MGAVIDTHRRIRQAPHALNCWRDDLVWPAGRRGAGLVVVESFLVAMNGRKSLEQAGWHAKQWLGKRGHSSARLS